MRYHDLRLTMHLPRWSCFSLFYFVNDAFLSTVPAGDQRWVQVIPRNCWSSARSHLRHVWDCRRHCRLRIALRELFHLPILSHLISDHSFLYAFLQSVDVFRQKLAKKFAFSDIRCNRQMNGLSDGHISFWDARMHLKMEVQVVVVKNKALYFCYLI